MQAMCQLEYMYEISINMHTQTEHSHLFGLNDSLPIPHFLTYLAGSTVFELKWFVGHRLFRKKERCNFLAEIRQTWYLETQVVYPLVTTGMLSINSE